MARVSLPPGFVIAPPAAPPHRVTPFPPTRRGGAPSGGRALAAISLALTLVARRAAAVEPPAAVEPAAGVALEWGAPAECPSADDVARDALQLLGPTAPSRSVRFEVEVTRPSATVWRARVDVVSRAGRESHEFEGESCQATADAAALVIALALNPSVASDPTKARAPVVAPAVPPVGSASAGVAALSSPPNEATPPPPAPPDPRDEEGTHASPSQDRPSAPAPRAPASLSVRLSPRFDSSTLPRPTLGAEVALAGRYHGVVLEAAGTYWAAEGAALASTPSVSGNYAMLTGALRACYELTFGPIGAAPCLAGEIDRVTAAGSGDIVSASGATGWGSAAAGGRVAWRLAPWISVTGLAEANIPLARPHFVIDGSDALYRVPLASLRASLGLELKIL